MPKSIEAEGVTVDEAIQNALNSLGLGRDSVEIEIVHHPRSGFLGIGARRAKVRATLREQVMRDGEEFDMAPDGGERGRRRRRSGRRRSQRGGEGKTSEAQPSAEPAPQNRRGGGQQPRPVQSPGESPRAAGTQSGDEPRGGRGGRRRGGRRSGRSGDAPRADEASQQRQPASNDARRGSAQGEGQRRNEQQSRRRDDSREEGPRAPAPARRPELDELLRRAIQLTEELMRQMGFDGRVEGVNASGGIELAVDASDGGAVLIGRRGTTLDALEHLIGRMTLGVEPGSRVRVSVDVCGYRDRRRAALVDLALKLKQHALSTGRKAQITPLSPQDRSVFLDALAGDDSVATRALGTGFYRRVIIIPKGLPNDGGAPDDFGEDGNPLSSAGFGEPEESGDDAEIDPGATPNEGDGVEGASEVERSSDAD